MSTAVVTRATPTHSAKKNTPAQALAKLEKRARWFGAVMVMVIFLAMCVTMAQVTRFGLLHGMSPLVAWLTDPLLSATLVNLLNTDAWLTGMGLARPRGPWPVALHLLCGLGTWVLNVWQSVYPDNHVTLIPHDADVAGIVLHSLVPALIIVASLTNSVYQQLFAATAVELRTTIVKGEERAELKAAQARQEQERKARELRAEEERLRKARVAEEDRRVREERARADKAAELDARRDHEARMARLNLEAETAKRAAELEAAERAQRLLLEAEERRAQAEQVAAQSAALARARSRSRGSQSVGAEGPQGSRNSVPEARDFASRAASQNREPANREAREPRETGSREARDFASPQNREPREARETDVPGGSQNREPENREAREPVDAQASGHDLDLRGSRAGDSGDDGSQNREAREARETDVPGGSQNREPENREARGISVPLPREAREGASRNREGGLREARGTRPGGRASGAVGRAHVSRAQLREQAEADALELFLRGGGIPTAADFGAAYNMAETWGGDRLRNAREALEAMSASGPDTMELELAEIARAGSEG